MNEIIAASKSHFGQYAKMKKQYTELVAWLARRTPRVERAIIRCLWYVPNRRKDPDNIMAGTKFILDGLVTAGVLPGDGWKQIAGIEHEFHVDRKKPRVEVEVIPKIECKGCL